MMYDPHSNTQIRSHRSDPTSRHSRLHLEQDEPWWVGYAVGVLGGCAFALILFFGV